MLRGIRRLSTMMLPREGVISLRDKYLSPSLKTFEAYDDPVVLTKGHMQYIWDSEGKKHIDLLGQNLCVSVGHCHPTVVKAAKNQMEQLSHCTTMYYHQEPALLAKELVKTVPPHPSGEDYVVHLVNSGSEAVDLAIQMAQVYSGRPEMYAMYRAYHGLHGYAAGTTAIGKATQPCYGSMFNGVTHLPPNNLDLLETHLKYATSGKVGGIIIEPLQGYGGILPLDQGYLRDASNLIKQYGGVSIVDEVQTGFCRTGTNFWGFEQEHHLGVNPDIIVCAKGLGNGVGIIAAVIARRSIANAFCSKVFFNTYGCNPTASAAARAVLQVLKEDRVMDNCHNMGTKFNEGFSRLCEEHPEVFKEIRGSGLIQGLEINGKDDDDSRNHAYEMHRRLYKYGVVVGRGSANGNVFRIQPPMCIQEEDVQYVLDSVEEVGKQYSKEKKL